MSMRNFILRRMVLMIPLFIGITILQFVLVSLSPIDIVDIQTTGNASITPDDKQKLKEDLHFVTRPETSFTAENAQVTVETGWTTTFPQTRRTNYDRMLALVRFDNSSTTPQDQSPTSGNTIANNAGYCNSSASTSMKNSTKLEGLNSITVSYTNWDITDELTIMFWMNWSDSAPHDGTLFAQGSNFEATIERPAVISNTSWDQTSIMFTVGDYHAKWTNHTSGFENASLIPNEWYHFGFVISQGSIEIYLDGTQLIANSTDLDNIPYSSSGDFVLGVSNMAACADDLFIFNESFVAEDMVAWAASPQHLGNINYGSGNFDLITDQASLETTLGQSGDGQSLTTTVTEEDNYAWQIISIDFTGIAEEYADWKGSVPILTVDVHAQCQAVGNSSLSGVETFVWTTEDFFWTSFGRTTIDNTILESTARLPGPLERWYDYIPSYGEVTVLVKSRERATDTVFMELKVDYVRIGIILSYETPMWEQYVYWLASFLTGDDTSWSFNTNSLDVIQIFAWETVKLQFASLILSLMIAVPIGVISATRQYSKIDNLSMTAALLGVSLPVFWTGLVLILIFAFYFPIFPSGGAYTRLQEADFPRYGTWSWDAAWHMVLPTIILGTASAALTTRLVRSSMLEVLRQDYIMTARSKGLTERVVIYKHGLRNALLPVVTIIGLSLGGLLGGAALTETVFSWPGLGKIAVEAVISRDFYLVLGINLILSMILIVANLLTDISYSFLDPRIRY